MTTQMRDKVFALLSKHEGCRAFMYLDSKNNPTVGIGHLLAKSSDALGLPFRRGDNNPTTHLDIVNGWSALKYQAAPFPLRNYPSLTLTQQAMEVLFWSDVDTKVQPAIYRTFLDFDLYPEGPQEALYDLFFNLGSLLPKFPNLTAAVRAQDWATAAKECIRRDVGEERNADTVAQFLSGVCTETSIT